MSEETPLTLVSLEYAEENYRGGVGQLDEKSPVNCDDGSTPTLKQYVEQHGGEVPVSLERFEDHVGNEDANAKHLSDDELAQLTKTDGKDLATEEWAQTAISAAVDVEKTRAMDAEGALTTAVTTADGKADAAQTDVDNLETLVGELPDGATATTVVGYVDEKVKDLSDTVDAALDEKQDVLAAGANITIEGNVISASGGAERVYNKFVVVGVYGQSNAVGYDESSLTKYDVPFDSARIMQYSDSLKPLTFCAENLQNMNTVQARNDTEKGNMRTVRSGSDPDLIPSAVDRLTYVATKGIHLPLANLICSVIPDDYGVIIVPGAYGGQGIDAFVRGQNYYTQFLNRIKAALALNENNVLAGIVWCQGEFDVGSVASTYIQKFEGIVNNLHEDIKAAHPRQLVDTYTPKNYWFVFEWPEHWRRNDSTHLLDAYKTSMGADHYVDIPAATPANTTGYTSATPAAHYGQDSYRKVIAPRVFAKMHAAGVFNTVATPSESSDSRIEELETQVGSMHDLIAALQERVNELSAFHTLPPIVGSWKPVTTDMITQVYGSGSVLGDGELSVGQNQTVLLPADVTRIRATPGDQVGSYRLLGMVLGAVPDAEPATASNMIAAFTYFDGNAVQLAHLNNGTTIKLSATSGSDTYNPGTSGWGNKNNPITTLLGGNTSHNDFELEKLDKAKLRVTNRTSGASMEMDMSAWPFFQGGGEIRFGFCGYDANNSGMKVTNLEYYS